MQNKRTLRGEMASNPVGTKELSIFQDLSALLFFPVPYGWQYLYHWAKDGNSPEESSQSPENSPHGPACSKHGPGTSRSSLHKIFWIYFTSQTHRGVGGGKLSSAVLFSPRDGPMSFLYYPPCDQTHLYELPLSQSWEEKECDCLLPIIPKCNQELHTAFHILPDPYPAPGQN